MYRINEMNIVRKFRQRKRVIRVCVRVRVCAGCFWWRAAMRITSFCVQVPHNALDYWRKVGFRISEQRAHVNIIDVLHVVAWLASRLECCHIIRSAHRARIDNTNRIYVLKRCVSSRVLYASFLNGEHYSVSTLRIMRKYCKRLYTINSFIYGRQNETPLFHIHSGIREFTISRMRSWTRLKKNAISNRSFDRFLLSLSSEIIIIRSLNWDRKTDRPVSDESIKLLTPFTNLNWKP